MMNSMQDAVQELTRQINQQTEASLQEQLGWLIDRKILLVEYGPAALFEDNMSPHRYRYARTVKLAVRDKEYIEKLEEEILVLKETITRFQDGAKQILAVKA